MPTRPMWQDYLANTEGGGNIDGIAGRQAVQRKSLVATDDLGFSQKKGSEHQPHACTYIVHTLVDIYQGPGSFSV